MILKSPGTPGQALAAAVAALQGALPAPPRAALVAGTGAEGLLQGLAGAVEVAVEGLAPGLGPLVWGTRGSTPVLVVAQPPRPWESGAAPAILFLYRVLAELGVERAVLTAAGASLLPGPRAGTVAIVRDHLDFSGLVPLRSLPPDDGPWPLFPDLTEAYDPGLRGAARRLAEKAKRELPELVLAAVPGPALPTPAEVRFLRLAGGEAVAMGGAPEVVAAVQAGIKVALLLALTQELDPGAPAPADLAAMVGAAEEAAPWLARLALELLDGAAP